MTPDWEWLAYKAIQDADKIKPGDKLKFGYPVEIGMSKSEAELLIGILELAEIPELEKVLERLKSGLSFAERHK